MARYRARKPLVRVATLEECARYGHPGLRDRGLVPPIEGAASAYATLIEGASYDTVGYWPMNDASGSTMAAAVGTNGTYVGTPTLGGHGGVPGESPNTCATFNGTSQAADAAINLSAYETITACCWLYLTTTTAGMALEFTTNYNSNDGAFSFYTNSTAGTLAPMGHPYECILVWQHPGAIDQRMAFLCRRSGRIGQPGEHHALY